MGNSLNRRQQQEYDELDSIQKLFYEPKLFSLNNILKELYDDSIIEDLIFKDNPFLKLIEKK